MGFFKRHEARDAYDQVYGGGRPHHEISHELLAGAAGFEAMRLYEHHREREGIVEHHELGKEMLAGFAVAEIEAKRLAREQADYLWQQQYGRY